MVAAPAAQANVCGRSLSEWNGRVRGAIDTGGRLSKEECALTSKALFGAATPMHSRPNEFFPHKDESVSAGPGARMEEASPAARACDEAREPMAHA